MPAPTTTTATQTTPPKPFMKPITLPARTPAFVPEVKTTPLVTPKVTTTTIECPYLGTIHPEPKLLPSTLLEMQAGRDTLARHEASRKAALEPGAHHG